MKITLTKNDAHEVWHKMGILSDEPDLQESYGITQEQANAINDSIPKHGGGWQVPNFAINAVCFEMQDHCKVMEGISSQCRGEARGESLRIAKQAKRLSELFPKPIIRFVCFYFTLNGERIPNESAREYWDAGTCDWSDKAYAAMAGLVLQ